MDFGPRTEIFRGVGGSFGSKKEKELPRRKSAKKEKPERDEMNEKPRAGACQLYRHLDVDGRLLYVGISLSAIRRTAEHSAAPWSHLIARIDIQNFKDRASAERAEQFAIAADGPLFNVQHRWHGLTRDEVGRRINFTLEEAYALAHTGDVLCTIDPVEFGSMNRLEKRHHRRLLNRIAKKSRKVGVQCAAY